MNKRKALRLKAAITDMKNDIGRLTSDQKQLKGELDNRRQARDDGTEWKV